MKREELSEVKTFKNHVVKNVSNEELAKILANKKPENKN